MRFLELDVPARHRPVVDAFKRAVADACARASLARTTVEVRSDGGSPVVVFTLNDPLGGPGATVECGTAEPPALVGRRAYRAAGRMLHGTPQPRVRPAG